MDGTKVMNIVIGESDPFRSVDRDRALFPSGGYMMFVNVMASFIY